MIGECSRSRSKWEQGRLVRTVPTQHGIASIFVKSRGVRGCKLESPSCYARISTAVCTLHWRSLGERGGCLEGSELTEWAAGLNKGASCLVIESQGGLVICHLCISLGAVLLRMVWVCMQQAVMASGVDGRRS